MTATQRSVDQEVARLTRIAHPFDQGKATEQLEKELYATFTSERKRSEEMVREMLTHEILGKDEYGDVYESYVNGCYIRSIAPKYGITSNKE